MGYAGAMSWPTVQYMIAEAQYGGKITDDLDKRLFVTDAQQWMTPRNLEPDFVYNPANPIQPIPGDFLYAIPNKPEHDGYVSFIKTMPEEDSPEIFGLHPNADLTFRLKSTNAVLSTLGEKQPKDAGVGDEGGKSMDEIVKEKCAELEQQVPPDYNLIDVKQQIQKQGGLSVPLNIFLYQEVQVIQLVIAKTRFELRNLQLAIDGDVVMTNEMQQSMLDINEAKVPHFWMWTIGNDEFSWQSSSIAKWFESLNLRVGQFTPWLAQGRPTSFWMTGFKNPNGFLTSMKQEVCRAHKSDGWALDDVLYHTEMTDFERADQVRAAPKEGVYVNGLFMDGAMWQGGSKGSLSESLPKILFAPIPVMWITGATKKMKQDAKSSYGPYGPTEVPLYKYRSRTDRYIICLVSMASRESKPEHWILRGAAVVCTTDA